MLDTCCACMRSGYPCRRGASPYMQWSITVSFLLSVLSYSAVQNLSSFSHFDQLNGDTLPTHLVSSLIDIHYTVCPQYKYTPYVVGSYRFSLTQVWIWAKQINPVQYGDYPPPTTNFEERDDGSIVTEVSLNLFLRAINASVTTYANSFWCPIIKGGIGTLTRGQALLLCRFGNRLRARASEVLPQN